MGSVDPAAEESKQMTLDLAHVVGLAFGCRFRISLAENAQKDDFPADAMYGQPDGPVVGGSLTFPEKHL